MVRARASSRAVECVHYGRSPLLPRVIVDVTLVEKRFVDRRYREHVGGGNIVGWACVTAVMSVGDGGTGAVPQIPSLPDIPLARISNMPRGKTREAHDR